MKAYTKPREVDYFLYKGRTKEFEEWCKSIGAEIIGYNRMQMFHVELHEGRGDLNGMLMPSEGRIIVVDKGGGSMYNLDEDTFYSTYDLPQPISSEYFEPDYSDGTYCLDPMLEGQNTSDYKVVYDPAIEKDGESFIDKIQVTKNGIPVTESLKQEGEELSEYVDKLARYYERCGQLWKDWMLKREWPDYQINPSHWVVKNTEELVKWARGRFVNDGKRRFVGTVTKTIRGGKPIVGRVWTEEGDKFVPEDPSYPTISLEALMSDVKNGYLMEI